MCGHTRYIVVVVVVVVDIVVVYIIVVDVDVVVVIVMMIVVVAVVIHCVCVFVFFKIFFVRKESYVKTARVRLRRLLLIVCVFLPFFCSIF